MPGFQTSAAGRRVVPTRLARALFSSKRWWASFLLGCVVFAIRRLRRCRDWRSFASLRSENFFASFRSAGVPRQSLTDGLCTVHNHQAVMCSEEFGPPSDLFRLHEVLSSGAQGTVHRCTRISTGSAYAAKVICTASLTTGPVCGAMHREIRIMRELHHPKIVNLHEAFWQTSWCIIVMDLVPGGDLYNKIQQELAAAGRGLFAGFGGSEETSKHICRQLRIHAR